MADRTPKQALGGLFVTECRQEELNGRPFRVYGAVEIAPFPLDPDVGFVDAPALVVGFRLARCRSASSGA